jgi:hypothetical protein
LRIRRRSGPAGGFRNRRPIAARLGLLALYPRRCSAIHTLTSAAVEPP